MRLVLVLLLLLVGCDVHWPRCDVDVHPAACNTISTGGVCTIDVRRQSWRSSTGESFELECGVTVQECGRSIACDCRACKASIDPCADHGACGEPTN